MKFGNLLNVLPGLLLFAAAILKWYQLIENPIAFSELWNKSKRPGFLLAPGFWFLELKIFRFLVPVDIVMSPV